jgi:hypothetical protein
MLWRAYSAPESELTEEEAASTLFRFFRSTHIVDLRLIVVTVLWLLGIYIIIIIVGFVEFYKEIKLEPDLAIKLVGPAVAIAGLVISWAYKAVSKRLGIIDLFGCEIATICRVGTIFDIGEYYVRAYKGQAGAQDDSTKTAGSFEKYTSQEDYFPIFDKNSSDLQLLEALIVYRITEFYTFMKATRDTQRRLATIPPPKEMPLPEGAAAGAQTPWHSATLDVVYMVFLGYEAGRKAIHHLVEFEPAAAENTIVILITELTCYGLLRDKLNGDPRYPRLHLREENYKTIAPMLYRKIKSDHGESERYWRPARELLPQLRDRYERALGETMDKALARSRPSGPAPHSPAVAIDSDHRRHRSKPS